MKKHLVGGMFLSILAAGFVSPVSLKAATIRSTDIYAADGTSGQVITNGKGVKTDHIQNLAVTGPKIAAGTITTNNIGSGQITNGLLGANAVSSGKIQDGAVTAQKIGIVCPDGEYLKYTVAGGWACSVGTPGPQGPQGTDGFQGLTGPQGPSGPEGPAGSVPHYANVVVVAKSGGDFTDFTSAVESVTDAAANNPYLIKVMPGVYDLPYTANMKNYVDIEGSGKLVTRLRAAQTVLRYGGLGDVTNAEVRGLTLESTGTGNCQGTTYAVFIQNTGYTGSSPVFMDVDIIAGGGGTNYGVLLPGGYCRPLFKDSTISVSGGSSCGSINRGIGVQGELNTLELESVTIRSDDGGNSVGIESTSASALVGLSLKNSSIFGEHGGIIVSSSGSPQWNYVTIRSSVIQGQPNSLLTGSLVDVKAANSQFVFPVNAGGTFKAIGCYEGNFDPLP